MNAKDLARIEYHRRHSRPDWRRFVRADWERVVSPAEREAIRKDLALCDLAFETPLARRWRKEKEEREREEQERLEVAHQREIEHQALKLKSELASLRFELVLAEFRRKANFNQNQPRVSAGNGRESGRWAGPGIGHNQGPPLEKPPAIPKQPPAATKERTAIAKQVARWLARAGAAVASRTPIGLAAVTAAAGATWLYDQYSAHIEAYRDPPKTLEELQQAALSPQPGYDVHHNVERASALEDGIPRSQIESSENRLLIPRMRHWEITGWYMRPNKDYGGLSPREYLQGKSWDERVAVGHRALIENMVLKP